jgi:two-component system, chemotaxis family, chemotaxis protein CheY
MATKSIVLMQPIAVPSTGIGHRYRAANDTGRDPLHKTVSHPGTLAAQGGKAAVKRVAIVDDEEDLVAVYAIMVRKWGHRVEFTGSDGTDIVRAFDGRRIQPDVVLIDYRMKTMNGLEAAKRIRSTDPLVRIVLVSADDSIKQDAISTGFVFLQKPFSSAELKDLLNAT